jgi:glycosyltransferase involved in cell wall biosynthesis
MHILLSSNGTPFFGAKGGYPSQLKHLIKMFNERGHTVTMLLWGLCGVKHVGVLSFRDLVNNNILPNETRDPWSQGLLDNPMVNFILGPYEKFPCVIKIADINEFIKRTSADAIFFLQDIFLLETSTQDQIACPSYLWFPLHYEPIDLPTVAALGKIKHIISLCPSTRERVKRQMGRDTYVVPHVIEFNTHLPPTDTKSKIRKDFNIDDTKYVICTLAGNYEQSGRKSLDTTLMAFKEFLAKHPEALMWVHAPTLNHARVYDVPLLVRTLGIPDHTIKFTENTLDETTLQKMYKCSDMYLCGSCSEGFGIPQLEAQYYGLPVVTTRFGAMHDYCWYGVSVPPIQRHFNHMQSAWWVKPSVMGTVEAMEKVYNDDLETTSEWVQNEVRTHMSYETVKNKILEIIEKK